MSRPIRVLHLRDSPWVDGPGRTILETASHLDRTRVDYHVGALVSVGATEHPLVDALRARGAQVHELRDRGGLDKELIAAIGRLIEELQIDVLQSSEFRSNVFALLAGRRYPHVKLVATSHGWIANDLRGRIYRFIDKLLLPRFHRVIFVSHAMRRLVPRWWLPDERVCVLHNALVLSSYGAGVVDAPRRRIDLSSVTVLNVGRLSREKGQDLLLRALAALVPEYPGLRLKFAGVGPLESELKQLAQALGIADRVEFLGYVHDMPALYANVDLLVQSSLTEGLPNIVLEAAYLRVPLIATRVGGTDEVVEHMKSAWLIRPGSVGELVEAMQAFLAAPERFVQMANAAHQGVLERFSFTARTERLMEFYGDLMCPALAGQPA
ncbi:MAG TPA: glycosyltransferase family 4 protein [Steroidobacteraceae bacterium]|jgi:glycosyltransferase involved in cell wall biosynthesis